jgi:hypothetical protein
VHGVIRSFPDGSRADVDVPLLLSLDALSKVAKEHVDRHEAAWAELRVPRDGPAAAVWLSDALIGPNMMKVPSGKRRVGTRVVTHTFVIPGAEGLDGERVYIGPTLVFRQRHLVGAALPALRSLYHLPTSDRARTLRFGRDVLHRAFVDGQHVWLRETRGAPDRCYTSGNTPAERVDALCATATSAGELLAEVGAIDVVAASIHVTST